MEVIQRGRKLGLGTAYVEGFSRALSEGAAFVLQMDADLSHPPEYIPEFLHRLGEADVVVGSRYVPGGGVDEAQGPLFFRPTVLADVPDEAAIMSQETFGPVAALSPFDTEDEVIARANATEYGLVAYLHSHDPRRIYRLTRALQYGMVAVNRTKVTGAPIPFGGMKQSGIGREGARQGLEAFTEIKYVCRDWA